jgi:hypothetical protein
VSEPSLSVRFVATSLEMGEMMSRLGAEAQVSMYRIARQPYQVVTCDDGRTRVFPIGPKLAITESIEALSLAVAQAEDEAFIGGSAGWGE